MAPLFPAILIGGPAHSGKSTLTYRLSQALRLRKVPHYALRASPDGDGDWVEAVEAAMVAELRPRVRSGWSETFAAAVARDVAARHLPLMVDIGGRVTPETEAIAAHCTHSLLISANPAALAEWRTMVARHGLVPVADLHSALVGTQTIDDPGPPLRGTVVGLSRTMSSDGPCFQTLVDRLADLFAYSDYELFQSHITQTDIELVLNLERPIYPLVAHQDGRWQPEELCILLPTLPTHVDLALYGRAPVWMYAALALLNPHNRCAIFDPRQGWVEIQPLRVAPDPPAGPLHIAAEAQGAATRLRMSIPAGYLDRRDMDLITLPMISGGVILDGRLPIWLVAALARSYQQAAWIACYQPQLRAAVVIASQTTQFPLGFMVPDDDFSDQKRV